MRTQEATAFEKEYFKKNGTLYVRIVKKGTSKAPTLMDAVQMNNRQRKAETSRNIARTIVGRNIISFNYMGRYTK